VAAASTPTAADKAFKNATPIVRSFAPQAGRESYDLALGLNRHPKHFRYPDGNPGLVERFAGKVSSERDVLAYPQVVARKGVEAAETGPALEAQLRSFMREAEHIHFQLDGMLARGQATQLTVRQKQHVLDVLAQGREFGVRPGNITNWEFHEVWTNYRDKATFYFKGKKVDLAEIVK
jgi:hypothetical protein